ncbi:FAD-containing oxidoreductase [Microlunatus panaciterrae]|uniref:Pyruvate/2-oxoglutarate dehydrogenase complex dihydrolipoamide dehydrogenase (E3) component n=1 Tax=Microlunatus panaciterrae TaxID=400768 RepID=A0ABS2RIY9_9ACTN|nr:mercuric reductase [Microlunatus panaciterrae]MBM7798668.1 pyruvate/2-oxoglutarate dehydrogenase complex dihydrolipoamide dehydrogenase (E3) component [Microlunatus panaciterrae]
MTDYDAIVVGAGQAGPGVAGDIAGRGERVAVVEMEQVGGTCLNHGCRPTKALRASGVAAHRARRAAEYGIGTGEVTVDFTAVMERMHRMIDAMRQGLVDWLEGEQNIDLYRGTARLQTAADGLHTVTVDGQVLTSRRVFLDLGARATRPPIPGLESVAAMTEVELLQLTELPRHLVVIGGGYIGLEFGQMFHRFGSEVTIVAGERVAAREDPEVSTLIEQLLTDEGVRVVAGQADQVAAQGDQIVVTLRDGSAVTGSHLLVSTGRRSNADLIGDAGLALDDHGFIAIDSRFQTSVPGVWALGDVNGHGAFTHTAYQDSQILLDESRTVDGRITAYAMFTDPPLGRVGMTETQARRSGRRVLKAEVPMSRVSRAVLDSETTGLMRILVDADTEEILGATFFGLHGDDLAQLVGLAIQTGVRYPAVRDALPIHPTVAEFIPSMLRSLHPLA